MKTYPSEDRIFTAISAFNPVYVETKSGISHAALFRFRKGNHHLRYETYKKLVAFCRSEYPDEDWTYPTKEDLLDFFGYNPPQMYFLKEEWMSNGTFLRFFYSDYALFDTYKKLVAVAQRLSQEGFPNGIKEDAL